MTFAAIDWHWWIEAERVRFVPPWSEFALAEANVCPLIVVLLVALAINTAATYLFYALHRRGYRFTLWG